MNKERNNIKVNAESKSRYVESFYFISKSERTLQRKSQQNLRLMKFIQVLRQLSQIRDVQHKTLRQIKAIVINLRNTIHTVDDAIGNRQTNFTESTQYLHLFHQHCVKQTSVR